MIERILSEIVTQIKYLKVAVMFYLSTSVAAAVAWGMPTRIAVALTAVSGLSVAAVFNVFPLWRV